MIDLTQQINLLSERIRPLSDLPARPIIAIAGPPGSGKTTLAEELARRLNAQKCLTAIVPQDGFHLDNKILETRGDFTRKGAPHTFDSSGFVHTIRRLKERADVVVPVFDRTRDLAIGGARIIPAEAKVIVVEGSYLLFDEAPWFNLAPLWTLSVRLNVPLPELRARLIQRWLGHGLSRAAATNRATNNDLQNAKTVLECALPADITLGMDGEIIAA